MDYYVIKDLEGYILDSGTFSSEKDAINWYNSNMYAGWLHKKKLNEYVAIEQQI